MKVSFITLGCKVNQYETGIMEDDFRSFGYEIVPFNEKADVSVIHTCAVTEESARKSRQMMRRAKKKNPDAVIVVVGCLCQTGDVSLLDCSDVIVGSKNKRKVPDFVGRFLESGQRVVEISDMTHEKEFEPMLSSHGDRTRAQIKVQDGCDNFCSYCIIPYARGRIRSKDICEAVKEAEVLVENGYKEIVLTGIQLDKYGADGKDYDLCDLMERIDEIEGLERIRIGSLEPVFINEKNIERLKNLKHLCHQFHLSLQSGCTKTLKAMNRHYTAEEYEAACKTLKETFEDVSVTTDIICGFPGETEEDHKESVEFAKGIGFGKIHVFPFSPRKGTRAYSMDGQVPNEIKHRRALEMINVADESEKAFLSRFVGKTVKVLFERKKDGYFIGLTPQYAEVKVKTDKDLTNRVVEVFVTSSDNTFCTGELKETGGI